MSERRFTGHIGRTVVDTDYQYETIEKHPDGSPNVVYILLDDLGFAGLGCYGSTIHTPNMDKLAAEGLRYNNFHTTAICSATRASLLTGANHHAVGVGSIIEMTTGCPNAAGHIDSSYGTIAEILKEYDYSTYLSGKWHLAAQNTPSGPYDNWRHKIHLQGHTTTGRLEKDLKDTMAFCMLKRTIIIHTLYRIIHL